ncbi:MAG: M12 family metallo-peptidase [Flavobacterium sp.]
MKKILTICSLFSFVFLFAQHEVAKKIQELENQKTSFKSFSVLQVAPSSVENNLDKVLSKSTIATIDKTVVNDIVAHNYQNIELTIPYNGQLVTVDLYTVDLFFDGFHIDTDKQKNVSYQKGVYYRGIVKGDYSSIASFNFFKDECNGIVSNGELSNLVIGKLDKKSNTTDYIIYADANLKKTNSFHCDFKDDESKRDFPSNKTTTVARCATIYFEIDYDLYTDNNSSITDTTNWMTSVFNNVQTIYSNDGITVSLKSMYIWTTIDPYVGTGTASTDFLYKFHQVRPVFDGDIGQLVSIEPQGLGGVAIGINGLCSQDNYSYSDVSFSYQTVPTYSWTIEVITHELGHLLGSPHTHACVWNGNNTAIDNCGSSYFGSSSEGYSCISTPPILPTIGGTIMSYCHLVSSVGINFSNGFGPQPSTRILNSINSGLCLSTDCINTCINTVSSIAVNTVTTTTALVTFGDSGATSSWQVAVYPLGGTPNWISITSNSYLATGLTPDTYYVAEVRPDCSFGLISGSKKMIFVTAADFCNGLVFTDSGGANNNYSDMENVTRIIIPNVPNNNVILTFTDFEFEQDYDYLYLYDGNTTSAPLLGSFTGTTLPGTFTSTAVDGSLTVNYISDQFVNYSGFIANISCMPNLSVNNYKDYVDFMYYPNPSNGKVIISSKTILNEVLVYNLMGQLLFDSKVNDLNTTIDISSFSLGTYFFKTKFEGNKEANFKVIRE